jgi:putative effector of murein hydrolase LrgA (UPF0299 family)
MVSTGTELKQLVVDVAAAGSGMSAKDVTAQLPAAPAPSAAGSSSSGGLGVILLQRAQLLISLATLYYLDQGIKVLFTQYAVKFPSALAGMFGVFVLLCGVGDKAADGILGWYNPALNWIARWLPLFYVPALVTLPLALNGIPGGPGSRYRSTYRCRLQQLGRYHIVVACRHKQGQAAVAAAQCRPVLLNACFC